MTDGRLPTHIWVDAELRRCTAEGVGVVVIHKGERMGGTVMLKLYQHGTGCRLLSQMRECWNVPVGAPRPEELIVQVRVFLTPDGGLARPPVLEPATRGAAASNPYMRTAAEAALRAVNVCEPYMRLPRDRYETWREIVMTFDPSKMIGR